jgi:hypothetical protein
MDAPKHFCRQFLNTADPMIHSRLGQRWIRKFTEFAQRDFGVSEPQFGQFPQRRWEVLKPGHACERVDRLNLRHGRLGSLLLIGYLGVDQAIHVIAHRLDDADVLGAQQCAMRAD